MDEDVLASIAIGKLRLFVNEFAQKSERISVLRSEEIPNIKKELFTHVEKIIEKDKSSLHKMYSANMRANEALSTAKRQEICKMFVKVFQNLKSKTTEVEGVLIDGTKLTVGKQGFGMRWHIQSEPISQHATEKIFGIIMHHDTKIQLYFFLIYNAHSMFHSHMKNLQSQQPLMNLFHSKKKHIVLEHLLYTFPSTHEYLSI